tara:strand:- start:398 stop:1798 length:1401 start_codon:yes stop_codon:yes gene_type:complete
MKQTQNQYFGLEKNRPSNMASGSTYLSEDTNKLHVYGAEGIPYQAGLSDDEQPVMDNLSSGNSAIESIVSQLDDTTSGGTHSVVYVEKYDSIYYGGRGAVDARVYKVSKDNPGDFTVSQKVQGDDGIYQGMDDMVYDETKDKLYFCQNANFTTASQNFRVWEVDPITLEMTMVIDYNIGTYVGSPIIAIANGFLFVANGYYTSYIKKFDLSDYSFVNSFTIPTDSNSAHALRFDGKKLYLTSIWSWANSSFVMRIDPTTNTLEQKVTVPFTPLVAGGGGFTDDFAITDEYIYVGEEESANNGLYRFNKSDLASYVKLDLDKNSIENNYYAVNKVGDLIYYAGTGNMLGSYNMINGENKLYQNPFSSTINEVEVVDGIMYASGFNAYPVSGTGYFGQVGLDKLEVISTTFNSQASGISTSSYSLGDLQTAPSSATDIGRKGEIRVTATAIYVCTDTNTWVKSDLATW